MAVLVFDGNAPEWINAFPVITSFNESFVLLCGYGRGGSDPKLAQPSCADKRVMSAEDNFYRFVPEIYEQLDPLLHLQFRAQFLAKRAMIRSTSALLAVNRIENERYQFHQPMPTLGDSGGPWIVSRANGQLGVSAGTAFIYPLYRSKNH